MQTKTIDSVFALVLSVIKDKADALRRMEQAEGTIADRDCRISIRKRIHVSSASL
jgi:hypothetical protein